MRLSERIAAHEVELVLGGLRREIVAEWIAEAERLEASPETALNDCPLCRGGDGPACAEHFL